MRGRAEMRQMLRLERLKTLYGRVLLAPFISSAEASLDRIRTAAVELAPRNEAYGRQRNYRRVFLPEGRAVVMPSAQPDWEGSVVIGVVGGTADAPLMSHLETPQPITDELLALARPVTPTEVFRFAAPCLCSGCVHFKDAKCGLAERVAMRLPAAADQLPQCAIRPQCRWWRQEGRAACMRCPQVVTDNYNPSTVMIEVATPNARRQETLSG